MARKKNGGSPPPDGDTPGAEPAPKKRNPTVREKHQRKVIARKAKEEEARALKRLEALEYRRMGYTYQEIADAMKIGRDTASKYVKDAIAEIPRETAEEVRELELSRIDTMLSKFMELFSDAPNPADAGMILKLMDQRAKYVPGLHIPPPAPAPADDPMSQMMQKAGERFAEMMAADRPVLRPDERIPANPVL